MTTADAPSALLPRANPIARLTAALFGWLPMSLAMLALRFALAVPFWKSGMTKWDGFLTLSFGAQQLFVDEFKLHLFGGEYAFPFPETMATLSALGETILPVLLVFGFATRYAALGDPGDDGDHPAHRARRLGQLPSAVGGDGAVDHDLRAGPDRARPRPRVGARQSPGLGATAGASALAKSERNRPSNLRKWAKRAVAGAPPPLRPHAANLRGGRA